MMKKIHILLVIALSSMSIAAVAQGRFGKDSAECVRNLSFYDDYYKQNDYKSAYPYWVQALTLCPPQASQNLYIRGLTIMKYFLENDNEPSSRKTKVDTLMMLYQIRMDNYPVDKVTTLTSMASEMLAYKVHNEEEVHTMLERVVQEGRENTDMNMLALAMQSTVTMYSAGKVSADKVIESFTLLSGYADAAAKKDPSDEAKRRIKQDIEAMFLNCDAASCETLEPLFKARFEQYSDDKEEVASIVRLLSIKECTSGELYMKAAETYYRLDPSPSSAYALAKMFFARNDIDKSIEYFREAINGATDNIEKSTMQTELAMIYYSQKNNTAQAVTFAKQAVSANSQNGKAYLLLGTIWAAQKCGSNEIERASVFWVAVDFFNRARQADPESAADANKYIAAYSQNFPMQGDAFMYDLTDGNAYTVNCNGLSERTTVRTRK